MQQQCAFENVCSWNHQETPLAGFGRWCGLPKVLLEFSPQGVLVEGRKTKAKRKQQQVLCCGRFGHSGDQHKDSVHCSVHVLTFLHLWALSALPPVAFSVLFRQVCVAARRRNYTSLVFHSRVSVWAPQQGVPAVTCQSRDY